MRPNHLLPLLTVLLASGPANAATVAGVSNAVGVYSLRKAVDTYTGAAINVRRSSDDTTMDIGFDGSGNLDTAALNSFVGSGNGYVVTWYDQAETGGTGTGATDADLGNQPQIVSSGSLLTGSNGLAAVRYSSGQALSNTAYTSLSTTTVLAVSAFAGNTGGSSISERIWSMPSGGSTRFTFGGNSSQYTTGRSNNGVFGFSGSGTTHDTTGQAFQSTVLINGSGAGATDSYQTFVNGVSIQTGSNLILSEDVDTFIIGAQLTDGTRSLNGNIQELLIFSDVLSSGDQSTLEGNQFAFYSVPEPSALMLSLLTIPVLLRRRK